MVRHIIRKYTAGIGIIEIIIGTSIITLALIGIVVAVQLHFQAGFKNTKKIQAAYLLEEGIEVVRYMRDINWASNIETLTPGTTYYLTFGGGFWGITTTEQPFIDNVFQRTVIVSDVYRKVSDSDIVDVSSPDPKILDSDIKLITVSLAWQTGRGKIISTTTAEMQTYFANIF